MLNNALHIALWHCSSSIFLLSSGYFKYTSINGSGIPFERGSVFKILCKTNNLISCVFNATNVKEKALISVREGLVEESNKKEYIDNSYITDKNIDNFLKVVWFVVDDKLPQDYIKEIIKNHPSIIPPDSELISIFNEIRNKQSELKNTNVEGVTIERIDEVLS